MTQLEATFRLARLLYLKGMSAKEALETAKQKVAKHPTADKIRLMRAIRERVNDT